MITDLTNKVYSSLITENNIFRSFYVQDGGKNQLAWKKNDVSVSLCILRNDLMLYMQTHDRLCSLYLAGSI